MTLARVAVEISRLVADRTHFFDAMTAIARAALGVEGAESVAIEIVEHERRQLRLVADSTVPDWPGIVSVDERWTFDDLPRLHRALASPEPDLMRRDDPSLEADMAADLDAFGAQSWLRVPLWADGRPIALLELLSRDLEAFDPERVAFWTALSEPIAAAITTLHHREELIFHRQHETQELMLAIARAATAATSLDALLPEIARVGLGVGGAERITIALLESDISHVTIGADLSSDGTAHEAASARCPTESWLVDPALLASPRPIVVRRGQSGLTDAERAALDEAGAGALLAVSFWAGGRPIGFLYVRAASELAFTDADVGLWHHIAQQTALAIQTVRAAIQAKGSATRQALRDRINAVVTSAQSGEAFRQLAAIGLSVPGAMSCEISLWHREEGVLEVAWEAPAAEWVRVLPPGTRYEPVVWRSWIFGPHRGTPLHLWASNPRLSADERALLQGYELGAALSFCLVAEDETIGVLSIYSAKVEPFSADAVEIGRDIADRMAVVIRELLVREQEQRLSDERAALLRISEAATSSLTLTHVLDQIAEASLGIAGAELCEIVLHDFERHELVVAAVRSLSDWPMDDQSGPDERYPIGYWSVDDALRSKRLPISITTVDDPRVHGRMRDYMAERGIQSMLLVPLTLGDQLLGVYMVSSRAEGAFPADRRQLLQEIATRTAVAIEHASALSSERQRAEEQAALLRVSQAASSSLELSEVLREIAEASRGLEGGEGVAIELFDERWQRFEVAAMAVPDDWAPGWEVGKIYPFGVWQIDHLVVSDPSPIVLQTPADPRVCGRMRRVMREAGMKGLLVVPIWYAGRCQGQLELYSRREQAFTSRSVAVAQQIADHAGSAIQNARLLEAERRVAAERAALLRINGAATSSLDLSVMLNEVTATLLEATGVEAVSIDVYHPETDEFEAVATASTAEQFIESPGARFKPAEFASCARILAGPSAFIVEHAAAPEGSGERRQHEQLGLRQTVCAPLWAGDTCLGTLVFFDRRDRWFPDLLPMAEEAARHIALAVSNARLLEHERRQALERAVLLQVGQAAVASLPLAQKLNAIARACLAIPEIDRSTIGRFETGNFYVEKVADVAAPDWPGRIDLPGARLTFDAHPWMWHWLAEGESVIHDLGDPALDADARASLLAYGSGSVLRIWLKLDDVFVGTLSLHAGRPGAISPATVALGQEIAAQTALTIRNSRLFEATQRHAAEQSALLQASQAATSISDAGQMLVDVARVVRDILETDAVWIERWRADLDLFEAVGGITIPEWEPIQTPGRRFPRSSYGYYETALARRDAFTVDYSAATPDDALLAEATRFGCASTLVAPLWVQDRCLGLMLFYDHRPNYYTAGAVRFAEQVAGQVALALANMDLLDRERQRADDRATLLRIAELTTSGTDLEHVLRECAEAIRLATGHSSVEIERWRPAFDSFRLEAVAAAPDDTAHDPIGTLSGRGVFWAYDRVLARPGAFTVECSTFKPGSTQALYYEAIRAKCSIVAPLWVNDACLGHLSVFCAEASPTDERVLRLLDEAASHIALAMANADLRAQEERKSREQSTLVRIGEVSLASGHLYAKLDAITRLCLELPEVEAVTVKLWDPERRVLEIAADVAIAEWPGTTPSGTVLPFDFETWFNLWLVGRQKRIRTISDPDIDPAIRAQMEQDGIAASAWTVIGVEHELIGAIGFHARAKEAFTEDTLRFGEAVASQCALTIRNARLFAETQALADQQAAMLYVSDAAMTVTAESLEATLREIAARSMELIRAEYCLINAHHPETDEEELVATVIAPDWDITPKPAGTRFSLADWPSTKRVLWEGCPVILSPDTPGQDPNEWEGLWGDGSRSAMEVPLLLGEQCLGFVSYYSRQEHAFDGRAAELAMALGRQTALAMERARTLAALAERASTDGLTGLLNHRSIRERLDHELLRAQREQTTVAVLMIDLNRFKQINDTYGHIVGDEMLQAAAEVLTETMRLTDGVGRYGGDEFLAVLPDTDAVEAMVVAERLLQRAGRTVVQAPNGHAVTLSMSIGFAVYPVDGETRNALVAIADRAMYDAKSQIRRGVTQGSGYLTAMS